MVANPADSVDGNHHLCWKAYERNLAMNTLISSIPTIAAFLAVSAALARLVLTGNRRLGQRIDNVETNLGQRIDENSSDIRALDTKLSSEIRATEAKLSSELIAINHRFDVVNQRFDSVNQRIDKALNLTIQ
jgi:hypothetical protein